MSKPEEKQQAQIPNYYPTPYIGNDSRIDINVIAMLLWQALLVGTCVAISHMGWYLEDAGAGEMGLQFGLITFGFLCTSMVLFHVGGVRDSLAMRAEFARENQADKWMRSQQRLQQRRASKRQYWQEQGSQPQYGGQQYSQFGVPNNNKDD